jgi:hypothetical protein
MAPVSVFFMGPSNLSGMVSKGLTRLSKKSKDLVKAKIKVFQAEKKGRRESPPP